MKPLVALAAILIGTFLTGALMASAYASPYAGPAKTDWPMFQHDARHSGQSPYRGITTRPITRWKKKLDPDNMGSEDGTGLSRGPDGTVYVSAASDLAAIDPANGAVKWLFDGENSRSAPAVDDEGRVYWGCGDSLMVFTTTGEIEWQ